MACRLSWNGKESVLHTALIQKYGTQVADNVLTHIYSDQFAGKFGNWSLMLKMGHTKSNKSFPLDPVGQEPTLSWLEKNVEEMFPKSVPLAMQPDNIEKIKSGEKTITNRKEFLDNGIYTLPDGTRVELKLLGKSKIRGLISDDSPDGTSIPGLSKNELAKQEGFKDWKDFRENNKFSMNFVEGRQIRHVYSITVADKKTTVKKVTKATGPVTTLSIDAPTYEKRIKATDADPAAMKNRLRYGYDTRQKNEEDEYETVHIPGIIEQAQDNPGKSYLLDIVNPGKSIHPDNNGFRNGQYAEMLDEIKREMGAEFPSNLKFNPLFEQAMFNSTGRLFENLMEGYNPDNRSLWVLDQQAMVEYSMKTEIAVIDELGNTVGSFNKMFSSQLQGEAVDTLLGIMFKDFLKNKTTSVDVLINAALTRAQAKLLEARVQKNAEKEKQWGAIVGSFAFASDDPRLSFASILLERFKSLGYTISPEIGMKLMDKYSTLKFEMGRVKDLNIPVEVSEKDTTYSLEDQIAELDNADYDAFLTGEMQGAKGVHDWSTTSFQVNPRDTASVRLKMWLSNQNMMKNGKKGIEPVLNSFGSETKINFESLFSTILGHVASTHDLTPAKIINILMNSANPDLIQTGLNLQEASTQLKNEFCKVMKLQYAEWIVIKATVVNKSDGAATMDSRIIQAQRSSQKQVIVDGWKSAFAISPMAKRKSNGERVMDIQRARVHYNFIKAYGLLSGWINPDRLKDAELDAALQSNAELEKEFKAQKKEGGFGKIYTGTLAELFEDSLGQKAPQEGDKFTRRDFSTKRQIIGQVLKSTFAEYNIRLSDDTVTDMGKTYLENYVPAVVDESGHTVAKAQGTTRDYMSKITKGTSMEGGFLDQFRFTEDGKPKGIFSAFFGKASGAFAGQDLGSTITEEDEDVVMAHNPLYTEDTTMKLLAGLESEHSNALYSINHSNAEGKSIWDFSMNTSLSATMQEMLADYPAFATELEKNILIGKGLVGSFYARHWSNNPKSMPTLKYFDALNYNDSDKGVTRAGMSGREQYLASILLYLNKGRNTGHFMSLTHSDKTMTPVFYGIPKLDVGEVTNGGITDSVQNELMKIFISEHKRVAQHQAVLKASGTTGNAQFDAGGSHFFFFQDFNKDKLAKVSPELFKLLYEPSGDIKPSSAALLKEMMPFVKSIISKHMQGLIEDTRKNWTESGITADHLDGAYVNSLHEVLDNWRGENSMELMGQKASILKGIKAGNSDMEELMGKRKQLILDHAAKDYTINQWLWNVNSAILFYGDPAECWNPKKHKSVDQVLAEYAKRLAKDIAPGQDLTWEENQKTYRTIVLTDVKEKFKVGDVEHSANGTDAQEVTTVQEHLDMLLASGLIDSADHAELSQVITDSWALPKNDPNRGFYKFSKSQTDKLGKQKFQPMKPVYVGRRKADGNGFAMTDYVKSSSYPLLPEYTHNTEMDKLRRMMEENGIQRAAFESAKKIGGPTTNMTFFSSDGIGTVPADIESFVQVLERKNLRIQQDVPYDEEKDHIKIVSQMNKLIVEGIQDIEGFIFEGKEINGVKVRAIKEELRSQMYRNNLEELMTDLGAIPDGKGGWTEVNKTLLIARLVDAARERGYSENEIALLEKVNEDGNFDFPPFLHTAVEKFEGLLMSMVKGVSETKLPGKSYVQSSSSGYKRDQLLDASTIDQSTLVYVGDYKGEQLQHMRLENGVVKPAQVYAPFNFSYESKGKTVKANINQFLIKAGDPRFVEGRKQIDPDKVPIELLQLVGARIPNQGHNSMIPVEIVAFIPDSMGDNLAVPSAITWQMGSDFDVDKLYTYKRPYRFEDGKFTTQSAEKNTGVDLENRYINLHWSILTHPQMLDRVLNQLDKPDLKEAAVKYTRTAGASSFWSAATQLNMFQSGKDAKALVGMTSLSVTFNSVIQNKNLRLGEYKMSKGKAIPSPTSIRLNGLEMSRLSGTGSYKGYSKHDNQTIFQSGAVDNAKDRYLDNLNITLATYPAIQAIHQLETTDGKILPVSFSTAMMVQDIIWEYSQEMRLGNDSMSGDYDANLSDTVYEKLVEKWQKQLTEQTDNIELSTSTLDEMWGAKDKTSSKYMQGQLDVLRAFKKLVDIGTRLGKLQRTLNQDTNGAGPSILYAMRQAESFNQIQNQMAGTGILGEDSLIHGTEQSVAYQTTVPTALQLGAFIFPMRAIRSFTGAVARMQGKDFTDLSMQAQKDIVRGIRSAVLSSSPTITMNSATDRMDNRAERARLQLGDNTLATRIERYKQTHLGNRFINRLVTKINPLGKGPDKVRFKNDKDARLEAGLIASDFRKLLLSEDPEEVMLGEDLIKYALLFNPQNGPMSFITQIPSDVLMSTDFTHDLRALSNKLRNEDEFFGKLMHQVIQHQPSLAREIDVTTLDLNLAANKLEGRDYPEVLTLAKKDAQVLAIKRSEDSFVTEPSPFLKFYSADDKKTILYKLQSNGKYVQYQRIDTLGDSNDTEYDLHESGTMRSIYPANRAGLEFKNLPVITQTKNSVNLKIEESAGHDDFYASWGLVSSEDVRVLDRVMERMSADRELPVYLRTLAANIKPFNDSKFTLFVGPMKNGIMGSYNADFNEMKIAPGQSRWNAADTILHEVTHKNTLAVLQSLGYLSKEEAREGYTGPDFEQAWKEYQKDVKAFQDEHPDLHEKVKHLDSLRIHAWTVLQAKFKNGDIDSNSALGKTLSFAMGDVHEFIATLLTNKEVMKFLNEVDTLEPPKNWLENLIDTVLNLLAAVGDFMGTKVRDASVLREAYGLAYHFVEETPHIVSQGLDDTIQLSPQTIISYNENEADMIESNIETLYEQEVKRVNDGTKISLHVTKNKRKFRATSDDPKVQAVLTKMTKQLAILDGVIARPVRTAEDKTNQIRARRYYAEIAEDAENLQATKDLMTLAETGAKQLEWANTIMQSANPHLSEVEMATAFVSVWKDLNDMHGGKLGEFNEEFKQVAKDLAGDAQQMWQTVARFRFEPFLQGSTLTEAQMSYDLKEQGLARQMGLGLARDTNPFIQHITRLTQEAKDNVTESRHELFTKIQSIDKTLRDYAKNHGLKIEDVYKKFIQDSDDSQVFGLVQKLNASWYKRNAGSYSALLTNLRALNTAFTPADPILRARTIANRLAMKREFFKEYWDSMLKRGEVIDPRLLFDKTTGARLTTDAAQKEYDRLLAHTGDKELLDSTLEKVERQIEKYMEDKEENESKGNDNWEYFNSPFSFMETKNQAAVDDRHWNHNATNKPEFLPGKNSEYQDKKYEELQTDEKLKETYNTFTEMSKLFRSYMPPSIANHLHDNFLPIINIGDVAAAYSMLNGLFSGKLGQMAFNAVTISQYEKDRIYSDEVPIKYTSTSLPRDAEGNIDLSQVSVDLPKLFEIFGDMAIHYRYMAPVKAALDVAQQIIQEENDKRVSAGKQGLNRLIENVEYYNKAMTAEKGMNHEGVMTDPRYDWNPVVHNRIKKEVADIHEQIEKVKKEIDEIAGNPSEDDLFNQALTEKQDELKALEAQLVEKMQNVRYLTGSAAANTLISLNQMKGMAFNPFSAVSNLAQGMLSIFIHSQAFRVDDKETGTTKGDYTAKQLRTALGMMRGNILKSYGSIASYTGTEQAQKIRNIMDKLGIIDVLLDTHAGYSNLTAAEKSAFKKTFDWTAWQKTGDFLTKGAMVVAMMLNKTVTVQENGTDKKISLFEALNTDGNWNAEKFGVNEDWYSETDKDTKQQEWVKFRNKVKGAFLIVFGSQDPNVPIYMKKYMLGRLLGQYRTSWINEGINTRFGDKYYDERLERTVEGRWKTYGRLKGYGVPLLMAQVASVITGGNAFEGVQTEQEEIDDETGEKKKVYREIQEHEIENMRKNLAGIAWTFAVTAALLLLRGTLPSEEEKRRRAKLGLDKSSYTKMMINILTRSQQDLTFYSSPSTATQLLGTPVPSVSVITDVMSAISAYSLLLGDDPHKGEKWLLKQTKALPVANNYNKIEFYMKREIADTHH